MDYRDYRNLMERYHELSEFVPDRDETEDSLIKKLMDISYEKKQISNEANSIIQEHIEKYEKDPGLLDEETAAMLQDFMETFRKGDDNIDLPITLRIGRLLLAYYQTIRDLENTVRMLVLCALWDFAMKCHTGEAIESTPYALMAEQYLDDFDKLSDDGKYRLVRCWLLCLVNERDPNFVLKKFREIRGHFEEFQQKMGDDFGLHWYTFYEAGVLEVVMPFCIKAEHAKKRGIVLQEPVIDLDKEASLLEDMARHLATILEREDDMGADVRASIPLYIAEIDYHLGKITMEELLKRIKKCTCFQEDYNFLEQRDALLVANKIYLDYLYKCSDYDRQYVLDEGRKTVDEVFERLEEITKDLPIIDVFNINEPLIRFISAASGIVDFDLFKSMVLNATVYADKSLYVHTMMVKEICLAVLDYILDHDPAYLVGVADKSLEYFCGHKEEILALMENCALFHDIGKYFCIDVVSNSSRRLTDDEFEVLKYHPLNFSTIYQGDMTPEIECIRDCALLHHRWYNEEGGYPQEKHTSNKPFVNILTIADCIDAATDNIGRPYGIGKTLEDLIAEFDRDKEVRYSGYISELLHEEEVQRKIDHVIYGRRKEIYCDIYLRME